MCIRDRITELSKVLPQAEIWAGGPEVSYDAEAFLMEYPKVRGVMRGEGETVFPALATLYIEGTGSFQTIAGITYRNDHGELQINEDGACLLYTSEIPAVGWVEMSGIRS